MSIQMVAAYCLRDGHGGVRQTPAAKQLHFLVQAREKGLLRSGGFVVDMEGPGRKGEAEEKKVPRTVCV